MSITTTQKKKKIYCQFFNIPGGVRYIADNFPYYLPLEKLYIL